MNEISSFYHELIPFTPPPLTSHSKKIVLSSQFSSSNPLVESTNCVVKEIFENDHSLTDSDLADIQAINLNKILADYHYDFYSIPSQLTNELIKKLANIRLIFLKKIFDYPDCLERVYVLQTIFKHSAFLVKKSDFESFLALKTKTPVSPIALPKTKENSFILFGVTSSIPPKPPERLTIYAALGSTRIDSENPPLPPSPTRSFFPISFDKQLPYGNLRKVGRAIVSEFANTSIALGTITYKDGVLYSNVSTTINGNTFECQELRSRCEAHLSNRLQLLYVLALACYNRKVHNEISLMESQTLVQVGTGGHELLEASHSAILTNLNLGFSRDLLFELARKPEPEFLDSKNKLLDLARSYGLDVEVVSANLSKEMIHSLKKNDPRLNQFVRPLIPYESDFGQNLSATVKLPKYCNQLDFQCEEALRARLTEELNNCYKGTVTPCCVYNFFVHGLIEALLSEKTKILEDLAKHDIQQKTIRDLEVVSKVSNKEILSEERLTKITLVVGRAFESHLHPTKEFMHAYSQLINDSISALKQDLYETIPGAKEFLETPFKDLHKISDLKIAPVLRMIRSYLIKLIPLDWQKHVNLDWPQSLNFLEDTEYLFEEKCNLDLAKLGYEWISKSILTSLRTKRICLASKTLPISSLFDVIDKIFKSNQTLFLLPKDDYSLRQKNDLIDLYLKLLQDAPNLLALLSSKSVEGELGAVKREPLSLDDYKEYQENLTKSRHDLSILNTQVFLPPADYLHEIIYYRIQRVEDDARYPQGLKIILDKPKYLKNPYFRKCFSEHLKERNMEKLSLKLGGMVEGYLWI